MLPKAKLKYIKSLQLKKYRKEEQCFIVEGAKSVVELLDSEFEIVLVAATLSFIREHGKAIESKTPDVSPASETELAEAGSLQTNAAAIAVVRMKPNVPPPELGDDFVLVLDTIRDPGNLGTIIRTADWYGIRTLVASPETADLYNPKTISASMGSFLRVHYYYADLVEFLRNKKNIFGTFLDGSDIHELAFPDSGYIVIGNESNGITPPVAKRVHQRIRIPRYGTAESLNAGIATAIVLDNLRRSNK